MNAVQIDPFSAETGRFNDVMDGVRPDSLLPTISVGPLADSMAGFDRLDAVPPATPGRWLKDIEDAAAAYGADFRKRLSGADALRNYWLGEGGGAHSAKKAPASDVAGTTLSAVADVFGGVLGNSQPPPASPVASMNHLGGGRAAQYREATMAAMQQRPGKANEPS